MDADASAHGWHGQSGTDRQTHTPANAALVHQDRQVQQPINDEPVLPAHTRIGTVLVLPQQKRRLRTVNPIGQRHHKIGQPPSRAVGALAHESSVEAVHRRRADIARHAGFSYWITEVSAGAADELSRSGRDVVVTAGGGHLASGSLIMTSDCGKAISNRISSATMLSTIVITSEA